MTEQKTKLLAIYGLAIPKIQQLMRMAAERQISFFTVQCIGIVLKKHPDWSLGQVIEWLKDLAFVIGGENI